MAQSYTRQSTFSDGDTITAALFNNEYNQLVNTFTYSASSASSTGHRHDGTAGHGGNIHTIGDLDFLNKIVADSTNNRWGVFVEVSSAAVEQIRIQDGAIVPVTDNDIDLGTSSLEFKDAYFDGTVTTDLLTVSGTTNLDGAIQVDNTITVGVDDTGYDVKFFGDTASAYMLWDTSADDLVLAGAAGLDVAGDIDVDGTSNLDNTDIDGTLAVDGTTISLDATTSLNIDNSNTSNGITIGTATSGVPISIGHSTSEVTINDNLTVTGTLTLGSGAELAEAELEMLDGITAGTVAASKAVVVDSNKDIGSFRNITLTGELDAATLDISGNVDIDGTTNLDAVDIDGATQIDATVTVGVDDTGYDVKFFGATSGAYMLWDESADDLKLVGAAGLTIAGNADIDGTLEADAYTVDGIALNEYIADTVGAMVSSNTETNITVTYEDGDNTLDFVIGTLNQDTTGTADNITVSANNSTDETVYPIFVDGATGSQGAESDTGLTYNPSSGLLTSTLFAGTLNTAAQGNITSLGTLTTLTVDDITINGSTISDSGDLTLDIGGDVEINVDGGDINFKDGSDFIGKFKNSSNNFVIKSVYQDADLIIQGNDGGSDVTAVTFDMSAAGAATFNDKIVATELDISGNVDIDGTLEADAYTVDGTALATYIRDTVGTNMLSSNTESGITVTYDTSNDNIDFAVDAAQTGITSLLATDIKIGEDDQTKIDFETADTINFYAGNEKQLILTDGALTPGADNILDLGSSSVEFKDAFFDGTVTADAFAGPLTGDVTGTASKATVTDSTANTNFPVVFHDESDGLLDDTGALRYNPSTGELLVPKLTVAGTTTTADTVTMEASNAIIFEGATADSNETTLSIVDPTSDHTQYLINQGGYIPVLAAATTTAISSTPAELNLLDGSSANTVVNSKAVIYGSSGELAGTLSTAAQTNVTSLGTLTALQVDNININGNTITSTDSNGNIIITPNGTGNVNVNADVLAIQGTEGETASLALQCDESDDAGDEWRFTINTDQTLSIESNISGSGVDQITLTPNSTVASSTTAIVGNATVGGTLISTGKITADAGIDIDNINIDGTTASLSGSSDFTIDVGGRIDLSADDNGEVRLYDGSSMYGQFKDDSDRFTIQGLISDADMLFVINDGSVATTALTIDASEGGQLLAAPLGVSVPSYSFSGDANTGMTRPTGDTLQFVTGGTERIRIDSSGMLGLGTTPRTDSHTTWSQFFIGEKGSIISERLGSGGLYGTLLTDNLYVDSDTGTFAAITTDESSVYDQEAGMHRFRTAASASAGAAPTLVENLRMSSSAVTVNEGSADIDFRVESNGLTHALFVDGGNNSVHIGNSTTGFHSSVENFIVGNGSSDEGMAIFTGTSSKGKIGFADTAEDGSGSYRGFLQYDHSGDNLNFGTAGTEVMRINSSGHLSINNSSNTWARFNAHTNSATIAAAVLSQGSSSGNALEINNANTDEGGNIFKVSGTGATTITTADNLDTLSLVSTDADANVGPNLVLYRNSASPADGDMIGMIHYDGENSAGETISYAKAYAETYDITDGTEDGRYFITTMVGGTERHRMYMNFNETIFNDTGIDLDFRVESDGNANMLFVDGGNDRVGIGDGTPSYPLDLYHGTATDNATLARFDGLGNAGSQATGGQYLSIMRSGAISNSSGNVSGGLLLGIDSVVTGANCGIRGTYEYTNGRDLQLFTSSDNTSAPTNKMYIKGDGKVLIGSAVTSNVAGNGMKITSNNVGSVTTAALALEGTGGDFYPFYFIGGGSGFGMVQITSGSDDYIRYHYHDGSSATTTFTLYQDGDVTIAGTLSENSDIRLKENIKPLDTEINKVMQLNPVSYNKIGNEKNEIGFVAQEVEEIYPEVVHTEEDGDNIKSVSYGNMVAVLTKSIQEQQKQIEELKGEIDQLKQQAHDKCDN